MLKGDGVRKAYASKGDDTTFSRWVKTRERRQPRKARGGQLWLMDLRHKALEEGRTLFLKTVRQVDDLKALLVSGHSNVKIGRDVRKGRVFRGWWIYTLSLQERATCPRSCAHWADCYGNNMPWAKRVDHRDLDALKDALEFEIERLVSVRGREGVLIRLHALGDFFSPAYVEFWALMLALHPRLAVFGYTARHKGTSIGDAIERVRQAHPDRFRIRWSDGGEDRDCTVSIEREEDCPADAFVCPEQTGKVEACGKCGLCWSSTRNVAFLAH